MHIIFKAKRYSKIYLRRLKSFEKREPVTIDQMQWLICHSYYSQKVWGNYLSMYFTLFTNQHDAERKAKTHSLAIMCMNMYRMGSSYRNIYEFVHKLVLKGVLVISEDVIQIDSKISFIESLSRISEDQKNYENFNQG